MTNNMFLYATFFIILPCSIHGWTPPIGIPEPEFGIHESHEMYKGKTYTFSTGQRAYPDAGYGPYTYYIDNLASNATDSDNPYGTPQKPRKSFPETFEAGSVIEVHGDLSNLRSQIIWRINGTKERPVFIRGVSKANHPVVVNKELILTGAYGILENFEFSNTRVNIRTLAGDVETHHIAVRNIESHSIKTTALTALSSDTTKKTNNIVFYNNYLHGDAFNPSDSSFPELDACGIYLSIGSDRVWIVDNQIHTFTGDAVGGGHGAKYSVTNYFIGRNDLHTCGENAVDFKEVENIVVSQNKMHNMQGWSSGSDGTAAVVHYGPKYSAKNVWFIANEIFDCSDNGIQVGGDQQYDVYIIENIIRNIKNADKTGCAYRTWSCKTVHFINNTVYNVDIGIKSDVSTTEAILIMKNNIIDNVSNCILTMSGSWHLDHSIIENNLFYNRGSQAVFYWNGVECLNIQGFKEKSRTGTNCFQEDPMFVDAKNNNFSVLNDSLKRSKTVDNGCSVQYDSLFFNFFGIHLNQDYEGKPRLLDGNNDEVLKIDIGCFESPGLASFESAPTKIRLIR